jgi:hypothetical protein
VLSPGGLSPTAAPIALSNKDQAKYVIQQRSPKTSFDDPESPESKALDWLLVDSYLSNILASLADDDDFKPDDRLVQRFALATYYQWYLLGSYGVG